MPIKLFDRVKQKTTTSGSGTITLGDSVDSFLNFSSLLNFKPKFDLNFSKKAHRSETEYS